MTNDIFPNLESRVHRTEEELIKIQTRIEEEDLLCAQTSASVEISKAHDEERVHASSSKLICSFIDQLSDQIKKTIDSYGTEQVNERGMSTAVAAMELLPASQISQITILTILQECRKAHLELDKLPTKMALCETIADRMHLQLQYLNSQKDPRTARLVDRLMKKKPSWQSTQAAFAKYLKKAGTLETSQQWDSKTKAEIGGTLIQLALDSVTFRDYHGQIRQAFSSSTETRRISNRPQSRVRFNLDPDLAVKISDLEQMFIDNAFQHSIMVTPPRSMVGADLKSWTPYLNDAYHVGIVKQSAGQAHQADEDEEISIDYVPDTIRSAVDKMSQTGWRVNHDVYMHAYVWFNEAAHKDHTETKAKMPSAKTIKDRDANASNRSKRIAYKRILDAADRYQSFEAIYFPHNLCFRTRAYVLPTSLSPQGNDLCRGLLEFAEGAELGERGLYWLKVHIANNLGFDKASFDERVAYVDERHDQIIEAGLYPVISDAWWMDESGDVLDYPWQCLAACMEYAKAHQLDDPTTFISHIPVHMDGACNGVQHHSAATRDAKAGAFVGLVPGDYQDMYVETAKVCKTIADEDAQIWAEMEWEGTAWESILTDSGDQVDRPKPVNGRNNGNWASFWGGVLEGKYARKLAKLPCMTTPYNISDFGMAEQVKDVLKDKGIVKASDKGTNLKCNYFVSCAREALSRLLVGPTQSMKYLKKMVAFTSSKGLPFRWTTPAGAVITMKYPKWQSKQVHTIFGKVSYRVPLVGDDASKCIKVQKQVNGAAANWVHSRDAAHMYLTINGVSFNYFAGIHDSFGCRACDVDELHQVCREQFVQMYDKNVWVELINQVEEILPEGVCLPENLLDADVPSMGDLNLEGILSSERFFS